MVSAMARAPFRLVAPVVPEHPMHKAFAHVLTLEIAPAGMVSPAGVCWWSIDLSSYRGPMPRTHLERGCIPSIPDMFLLYLGRAHFIELKTQAGHLREDQRTLLSAIVGAGGRAAVITTTDHLLSLLDDWKIPRKHKLEP